MYLLKYQYKPIGICAREIQIDVVDGIIQGIDIMGGCDGNSQGIAKLCIGKKIADVVEKLQGIRCGYKNSSCPDQIAVALKNIST